MTARSAIWLDAPPSIRRPRPKDAVRLCPWGPVADAEALVAALTEHEIVLTAHTPVPLPVLRRCRWVRAVVGIGPEAADVVNWDQIRSASLIIGQVETASINWLEMAVRLELARVDRRLRTFDALKEGWEGA